jgi:adenylylsulfate kinase-like enzyme
VSDPYEPPTNPDVVVRSDKESVDESVDKIVATLKRLGYVPASV